MRIFLFIVLLVVSSASKSQVLQWSNPTKLRGTAIFTKVIGENDQGVYMMRYRNRFYSKNVILEKYSHHLSFESAKSIDLNNARLIKIHLTKKGLVLVKSSFGKKNETNQLIGQLYSFDLKPVGEPKLLVETPVKEFGDRGNYRMRLSDNQAYVSLLYTDKDEAKNIIFNHVLYDSELNKIEESTASIPIPYENFIIKDFMVNSTGKVNFLCKTVQRQRKRVINSTASVYRIENKVLLGYQYADTLEVKSSKLIYDRVTDKIKVVAFYGDKEQYGINGSLFFEIDSDGSTHTTYNKFSEEFIEEVNVNDRNNGSVSEGFDFLKAIPRSDGGVLIIAEQKEIATEDDIILVNGIPQSTSKNIYNFNEILVLNYDQKGFLDWYEVITKNQTTINDGGYFSSAVVYIGDKFVQLYYNDQLRSSGDVVQHTIYNNGKSESSNLLKADLDYVAIIPIESKQVSSNKVIIPTSKNRRFALLKIIYD
jgi:hypothetical protein